MFNSTKLFRQSTLIKCRNSSSKSKQNVPVFQYAKDNNKRSIDRVYVSLCFNLDVELVLLSFPLFINYQSVLGLHWRGSIRGKTVFKAG